MQFQAIGGKLSTDKFGDPKLVEYEGTSYAQGVVKIGQNMWDNLDGWSRFLVTIAPAITPVLIIAAVALIVGLLLGTAEKARGLHISTGAYLARKVRSPKNFQIHQQQHHHRADYDFRRGGCHSQAQLCGRG